MTRNERWHARAYYAAGVTKRHPKSKQMHSVGGQFAIEVWAKTRDALQMDLDIFEQRADIGHVDIRQGAGR